MEKLNQSLLDLLPGFEDFDSSQNSNVLGIIKKKGNKKVSILDDIQQQKEQIQEIEISDEIEEIDNTIGQTHQIVLPKSMAEIIQENLVEKNQAQTTKESIIETSKLVNNKKTEKVEVETFSDIEDNKFLDYIPLIEEEIPEEHKQQNQVLIQYYNDKNPKIQLDSEKTDLVEVIEEIKEIITDVPEAENLELSDFDIIPVNKQTKSKFGYVKNKVTLKKDNIPNIISDIATKAKTISGGDIIPRIADVRVIANTNKTQLRGSALKLHSSSVVFKPRGTGTNRVNKGTRIILSTAEDFESTKSMIVYIQESRDKYIIEIPGGKFSSESEYIDFYSKLINSFYTEKFDVTRRRLHFGELEISEPLLDIAKLALDSRDYLVRTTAKENVLDSIIIKSKGIKNEWLGVLIRKSKTPGFYNVFCISKADSTWRHTISAANGIDLTITDLKNKIITVLYKIYNEIDWTQHGHDEKAEDLVFSTQLTKLTYRKLKDVLVELYVTMDEHPEIGVEVANTLSQKETSKVLQPEYGAESIVGKTSSLEYFIITRFAMLILGGDKRAGKDYITTPEYNEKYKVGDKRPYNKRERTILTRQGEERNYNSRPFIFQIEYSMKGTKYTFRAKTYDEIKEATNFLTSKPNKPTKQSL